MLQIVFIKTFVSSLSNGTLHDLFKAVVPEIKATNEVHRLLGHVVFI